MRPWTLLTPSLVEPHPPPGLDFDDHRGFPFVRDLVFVVGPSVGSDTRDVAAGAAPVRATRSARDAMSAEYCLKAAMSNPASAGLSGIDDA